MKRCAVINFSTRVATVQTVPAPPPVSSLVMKVARLDRLNRGAADELERFVDRLLERLESGGAA